MNEMMSFEGYHEKARIVAIVGPSAVGKTAIIRHLIEKYPDTYHKIGSFTTRERRPDDISAVYDYVSQEDVALMQGAGEIVQKVRHPNGHWYGTLMGHYHPSKINVGDFLTSSIDELQSRHASPIKVVGIIASHEQWASRIDARYPNGHPERELRLLEARECEKWLSDHDYFRIVNDFPTNEPAADMIHTFLHPNKND